MSFKWLDASPSSARLAKLCMLPAQLRTAARVLLPTTNPKLHENGEKYRIFQNNAGEFLSIGLWHTVVKIIHDVDLVRSAIWEVLR